MPQTTAPRAKAPAPREQAPAPGAGQSASFGQRFLAWLKGKPIEQQQEALSSLGGSLKPSQAKTPQPPTPAQEVPLRTLAEGLVDARGSAGAGDKQAVVAELIKIPRTGLELLKKKGTRVVVCKGSVTDYMTNLKGVQPRGWPPGKTWDIVPGLFDPNKNEVVIATKDGRVPRTGEGHGSANVVLHEVGHAIDHAGGDSGNAAFVAAREKDKGNLTAYELQAGEAGLSESYAEGFARFLSDPKAYKKNFPALYEYWSSDPLSQIGK